MKHYPDLLSLLHAELQNQAPSPERIPALQAHILAKHPTATHLVLYKNGHWILLPVGPDEPLKTIQDAAQHIVKPRRHPRAYCKVRLP